MATPYSILPDALAQLLLRPVAPTVLDVCTDEDHVADPRLIPTTLRMGYLDAYQLDAAPPISVIVCHKGLKLSQGVAAALRSRGTVARFLEGGRSGWISMAFPLIPDKSSFPKGRHALDWVCPVDMTAPDWLDLWMIRRCVDPVARFLFVERAQIPLVTERFGATRADSIRALINAQLPWTGAIAQLRRRCEDRLLQDWSTGLVKLPNAPDSMVEHAVHMFDALYAKGKGLQ